MSWSSLKPNCVVSRCHARTYLDDVTSSFVPDLPRCGHPKRRVKRTWMARSHVQLQFGKDPELCTAVSARLPNSVAGLSAMTDFRDELTLALSLAHTHSLTLTHSL